MISAQRVLLVVGSLLCLFLILQLYQQADHFSSARGPPISHEQTSAHTSSDVKAPSDAAAASEDTDTDAPVPIADACAGLAGLEDLVIILKTGASEIYQKLPIHFATTFACDPDFRIYSDLEQDFGRTKVKDALALVSDETKVGADFAQYRTLLKHVGTGGDAAEFKGEKSWQLDKFKFLPMVSDAWDEFGSSKKWFVFIEADTYISMHNLLLWLRELNPAAPIYTGAQILIGATEFAHGGSGFLMSAPAVRALSEVYTADKRGWEQKLSGECCGDKVMGDVLMAAQPAIGVLRSFPTIQGETPASLDWSPVHYCMPAVSWHHADAAAVDKLWNFEQQWRAKKGPGEPILFRDYYAAFVHPRLVAANWTMPGWDNLSKDWTWEEKDISGQHKEAYRSAEDCEQTCRAQPACVQWAWRPGSCRADKMIRLGWALDNRPELGSADDRVVKAGGEGDVDAVSGWLEDRIEAYRKKFEPCGDRSYWITKNA